MITFVKIPIGTGGGVRCRRCAPEPCAEEFFDTDTLLAQVRRVVAGWETGPGPNIAYVGAEPYRHRRLPTLVQGAIGEGVERMCLSTDATALGHDDNASGSVSAGVRHIEVPLLGGSAGTHDVLCATPGAFDQAMAGMKALRQAGIAASVPVLICGRVRVCSHNVKDLPAAVLAFAEVGASSVTLQFDGDLPIAVVRPWVSAAIETGIINSVWVALEGLSAKDIGTHRLHDLNTVRIAEAASEAIG